MTIALAAVQGLWPPVSDAALLAGQLAPASIAGYRRDVALYLRFCGEPQTALQAADRNSRRHCALATPER